MELNLGGWDEWQRSWKVESGILFPPFLQSGLHKLSDASVRPESSFVILH